MGYKMTKSPVTMTASPIKKKGFKAHNMYKTEKAETYKEHLALAKKGYDHSPYKKKECACWDKALCS